MADDLAPKKKRRNKSGRHPENALNAVRIRTLTPGRYIDGNGLYLEVDPSGAKRWLLRVVIQGKRHDMGLGGLNLVSLKEAREEAIRLRKAARAGGDPLSERRREREALQHERDTPTFETAANDVHASYSKSFRNEKHKNQWIATLKADVFPVFGSMRIDHITSNDVHKALLPIWLSKPETARRVKQRIRTVFEWAKAKGYRPDNPTDGITKALPKHNTRQKHHPALPYSSVPEFIQQLRSTERCTLSIRLGLEFLLLTTARTSEVLHAKWIEIDSKAKKWTVPADRMKFKVEHQVPLAPRALEILTEAKKLSDGGSYIFPGRSPKRPLSNMSFDMALRRMKRTGITVHGFRSSFRDWAEEKTNFPNSVIEAALAHTVRNKVEAAYLRTKLFDKRVQFAEAWAAFATGERAKVARMRA